MTWKDTTGYSRNGDRIPTTWSLDAGDIRITVTCNHIYYKGEWIVRCEPFFEHKKLFVKTKEEAQTKAIAMVRVRLESALTALQEVGASK